MNILSIIVPVFNTDKYISTCLDSIVCQLDGGIEVIIVNDGSTDNSGHIADNYAHRYECIKVIHQFNQGVSAARNMGLSYATGDYIWFVDGDDLIADHAIRYLEKSIHEYNSDAIFFLYQNFYSVSESVILTSEPSDKDIMEKSFTSYLPQLLKYRQLSYSPCDKIIKRQMLLDSNIRFKTNLIAAEDYYWNYEIFKTIRTFTFIDKIFYSYRKGRLGSATTTTNREHLYSTLVALESSVNGILRKDSRDDFKALLIYSSQLFFYNLPEFYKSGLINSDIEKRFYDIYQIYKDNNIELRYFNSGAKTFNQISSFMPWRYSIRIYSRLINIRRYLQSKILKQIK